MADVRTSPSDDHLSLARAPTFELRPVRVAAGAGDEYGVLVFVAHQLVAVLVRLEAEHYEDVIGSWHLEIGFGVCAGLASPFPLISDALRWIADRLPISRERVAGELSEADQTFNPLQAGVPASRPSPAL